MDQAEALLIGGRAGVGKTSVALEVSALLRAAEVPHCVLEGDYLGQVHPAPPDDPRRSVVTERNLTALWSNFADLGHRRLIYTNTVSVLTDSEGMFRRAMGEDVRLVRVLLTASDATAGSGSRAANSARNWSPNSAEASARPASWTNRPRRTPCASRRTAGTCRRSRGRCSRSWGGLRGRRCLQGRRARIR